MPTKPTKLTSGGREDLALALLFLKDFKDQGTFDVKICADIFFLADFLGITQEYSALLSKIPPMKITPRYPQAEEQVTPLMSKEDEDHKIGG